MGGSVRWDLYTAHSLAFQLILCGAHCVRNSWLIFDCGSVSGYYHRLSVSDKRRYYVGLRYLPGLRQWSQGVRSPGWPFTEKWVHLPPFTEKWVHLTGDAKQANWVMVTLNSLTGQCLPPPSEAFLLARLRVSSGIALSGESEVGSEYGRSDKINFVWNSPNYIAMVSDQLSPLLEPVHCWQILL